MAHIYNSQLDAYTLYHKQHEPKTSSTGAGPALPALGHALAGSTGAAISSLCIYPLDLIITRLQVQRQLRKSSSIADEGEYQGVLDAARHIYNDEGGLSAFYTGVVQDTGKSITDSFLFFLFYNYMRQNRLQKYGTKTTSLPIFDELAVGAFAGVCSKFFTTPIANIVTRKQTASMLSARASSPKAEPSVRAIVSQIRNEKGIQGFWSGYSASLVLTLNPSLTFFLYETFKRTLLPRSQRDDPGARITFLMAAVSKAIASSVTYPFSLAKSRAQAGSCSPSQATKESETTSSNTSQRATVFTTIRQIYSADGLAALYEGIWGEIAKGFFSHGITMLVKEAVHKLIIQLYFLVLRTLKKMPTVTETEELARDFVRDAAAQAKEAGQDMTLRSQDAGKRASQSTSEAYVKATERAGEAYSQVAEKAGEIYVSTTAAVGAISERANSISSQAKDISKRSTTTVRDAAQEVFERAQDGVKNVSAGIRGDLGPTIETDRQKSGAELVREEKGHLLGNAGEMLRGDVGGGAGNK